MFWTATKVVVGGLVVAGVAGVALFGSDLSSYARSAATSVQQAAKDRVPVEFELRRAKDLLDDIEPEIRENIRTIAREEVEIAQLRDDIERTDDNVKDEKQAVIELRHQLDSRLVVNNPHREQQLAGELSRRFERLQEAETVLEHKKQLLETRRAALAAALQTLDKVKHQKLVLEDKIKSLEAQHRMIQSASIGTGVQVDNSKLAQTEKLIAEIKKRLDVSERVLAHEGRFTSPAWRQQRIDTGELSARIDAYIDGEADSAGQDEQELAEDDDEEDDLASLR
jgi:chromosome segregation ATPase